MKGLANASQHLQTLKGAQLVSIQKEGHYVHYRLADEKVYLVWKSLRDLGIERFAQIERTLKDFREQKNSFQSISIDELIEKAWRTLDMTLAGLKRDGWL